MVLGREKKENGRGSLTLCLHPFVFVCSVTNIASDAIVVHKTTHMYAG